MLQDAIRQFPAPPSSRHRNGRGGGSQLGVKPRGPSACISVRPLKGGPPGPPPRASPAQSPDGPRCPKGGHRAINRPREGRCVALLPQRGCFSVCTWRSPCCCPCVVFLPFFDPLFWWSPAPPLLRALAGLHRALKTMHASRPSHALPRTTTSTVTSLEDTPFHLHPSIYVPAFDPPSFPPSYTATSP